MIIKYSVVAFTIVISFILGKLFEKRRISKILNTGTGKYGVIKMSYYSSSILYLEIEELESAGELTKVKIIGKSSTYGSNTTINDIMKSSKFNEWVHTSDIVWYNDAAQKMRDKKLNDILN